MAVSTHQSLHSTFLIHKRLQLPLWLNKDGECPRRSLESCNLGNMCREARWKPRQSLKAASPSPVTPASHHHAALSRATHCFYFSKSDQLFSFGVFLLRPEFQERQGEGCRKQRRPGAALQSGLHYSSHAFCRNLLCSLPGTEFSWRFSSVISLFTEPWPWTSCLYLICTCPHGP